MQKVLGHPKPFTTFYCDDIIVFSKNIDSHWSHLRQFFEQLQDAGLPIITSKCKFAKTNVDYLGNNISVDGIRPLQDHVTALNNYLKPKTIRELRL